MKRKEQNLLKLFLLGLSICLFLLLGNYLEIFKSLGSVIQNTSNPVKAKIYSTFGAKKLSPEVIDSQSILRKIAKLEADNASLKKENEAMKRLLQSNLPPSWKFLSSKVIGQTSADYLQIDKGSSDKVIVGSAVVFENTYLGQITSVSPHFSLVILPTNSDSKILASAKDENGQVQAKGILAGKDNRIYLEKVLMKEKLNVGDLVVTTGEDNLPPDIPIGHIEKVFRNEDEIYQQAQVKSLIDPKTLNFVFVVSY